MSHLFVQEMKSEPQAVYSLIQLIFM